MLISIDGIDGSGKSTQVRLLAEALGAQIIQEISPSKWGKLMRSTENPTLGQQIAWFTADRAQLSETLAEASGSAERHIVTDRSYLSSVGYQSFDSPLSPELLEDIGLALMPPYDLQIVMGIPVDVALQRVESRGEKKTWCENPQLLTHAAAVFDRWAETRNGIVQVNADQSIEAVHRDVMAAVAQVES